MKQLEPSRKEIWKMFDQISATYDRVNRIMTCGLDLYWRKTLCRHLPKGSNLHILDCATGTCDQILSLMKHCAQIQHVTGIDLAEEMLAIGFKKISQKPYASRVSLKAASALAIPFPDESFDCVTISFGIRNMTDVSLALQEFYRVLKPQGKVLILEGSLPENRLIKTAHLFYLRSILPRIGAIVSKKRDAYRYLNQTIETFPAGQDFLNLLNAVGFIQTAEDRLTAGAVTIYCGNKKK